MKNRIVLLSALVSSALFVGCKPEAKPGAAQTSKSSTRESQKVTAKLDAIRQAGYPVTLAELEQWIPTPPPDQNAATKYTEAFAALVKPQPPANAPRLPARAVRLPADTRAAFTSLVASNKAALDQLQQATVLTQSCYPIKWDRGFDTELPHLVSIRSAAQVLQMQGALHAEDPQLDMAVNSVNGILSLARSLDSEPMLLSQLVRIGVLGIAHGSAERLVTLRRLPDAKLATLQSAFRDADRGDELLRGLIGERCLSIRIFQSEPQQAAASLAGLAHTNYTSEHVDYMKSRGVSDFGFYLEVVEDMIAAAKSPFPQCLASFREASDRVKADAEQDSEKAHFATATILASLSRAPARFAESAARLRTAQVALAVERYRVAHGRLPPDLAALVPGQLSVLPEDPFTGKPILFKPLAKGFVVYSVGSDSRDDGGHENPRGNRSVDGYDVTFVVER